MDEDGSEIVALDIGGSAIKSGIVSCAAIRAAAAAGRGEGGRDPPLPRLVERRPIDSGADADGIVAAIAEVCNRGISHCRNPGAVAIAFPGPCDYERGIAYIRGLTKFGALYGKNVKALLAARLVAPLPVTFVNDAAAAGVGEAAVRALAAPVLMITLGTGFGTAFLDGMRVRRGPFRWSQTGELFAEPAFGQRADDVFSVRGLDRRLAAHATNCAELGSRMGQEDITPPVVDELASFGHDLGRWLAPYVAEAAVSLVIVGGGLSAYFPWFGPALADALPVAVERTRLGDGAGLVGAACMSEMGRVLPAH